VLAGIIAPFILCLYWRKANRSGALAGILSGLGTWAIALAVGTSTPPDLLGFVASLVVMIVVTLTTQRLDPPRPLRDADGHEVDLRDRLGTLPLRAEANPAGTEQAE
jgi:Na+/proline symporter